MRIFLDTTSVYFQGNVGGVARFIRAAGEHLAGIDDAQLVCVVHAGRHFYIVPRKGLTCTGITQHLGTDLVGMTAAGETHPSNGSVDLISARNRNERAIHSLYTTQVT